MKLLRLVAALLGLLLVLVALAVGALLLPSVQTRLAQWALARGTAVFGTVGAVDAGLQKTSWTDLQLRGAGWKLTVPSATVELPALPALQRRVQLRSLTAHGWLLDLSPAQLSVADASSTPSAQRLPRILPATIGLRELIAQVAATGPHAVTADTFRGIFPLLDLPVDLNVERVDLDGEIVFRSQTGGPLERIHVSMTGGGLASGKTAQFVLTGESLVKVASMPWDVVRAHLTLQAQMANPRQFDLIDAKGELNAENTKTKGPATRLLLTASVSRANERESYALALRAGESAGTRDLLQMAGTYPDAQNRISGSWRTDANDVSFTPFLLGATLPAFAVKGEGRFDADDSFQELHAVGKFSGQMGHWEMIQPSLVKLGTLQIGGNFDVRQNAKTLRIEGLSVQVANEKPVLSLVTLQGIELDADSGEVRVADPHKDLVKVNLAGLPTAWAQPFLDGVELSGGPFHGELIGQARESGLLVRSTQPLVCSDLNLRRSGLPLLEHVDAFLNVSGMYSPEGWQADVSNLELRTSGRPWLNVSAKVGKSSEPDARLKSTGHYQLDLLGGANQPALAQLKLFQGGKAEGDFSAVLGALHQFAATVEMKSLAIPGLAAPWPSASLLVRADVQTNGSMKLQIPFQIQHGSQHSDGQLSGDVHTEGNDYVFDAQVTSDLVSMDDLLGMLAAFDHATAATAGPVRADAAVDSAGVSRGPGVAPVAVQSALVVTTIPRVNGMASSPIRPSSGNGTTTTASPANSRSKAQPIAALPKPIWAGYRGRVLIGLKRVTDVSAGFEANDVAGRVVLDPNEVTFDHLTATLADNGNALLTATLSFDGKGAGSYSVNGDLNLNRVNPARYLTAVAKTRKPTVEGLFDLKMTFSAEAQSVDLLADSLSEQVKLTSRTGKFRGFAVNSQTVDIDKLQRTASTVGALLSAAAGMVGYGEGVSYSDKLRASADALHGFSEIDYDQLNVEVTHAAGQDTKIADISLISPEIRFVGSGTIDTDSDNDWFARPVHLQVAVAVRGKQAENLKKIGLVGPDKDTLGYVPLLEKFPIEGSASSLATDTLGKLLSRALAK